MKAYNITRIRVKILEHGINASVALLPRYQLSISKKLLQILNEEELETIVAHEFSHIFNRDLHIQMSIRFLFLFPLLVTLILYLITIIKYPSDFGRIAFVVICFIISFYILNIGIKITKRVSVRHEIRSDWEALLKTKNPEALKNALFKMWIEQFSTNRPPYYSEIIPMSMDYIMDYFHGYTHPDLKERLEYLELAERMLKSLVAVLPDTQANEGSN